MLVFDSQNYILKLIPKSFNKLLDFKSYDKSLPCSDFTENDTPLLVVVYSYEELLNLLDMSRHYQQIFLCSFDKELLKKASETLKVIPIDISTHNFELEDKIRNYVLSIA